jgi:HK97 family phage portal protein
MMQRKQQGAPSFFQRLSWAFSTTSYPFPIGSQNRDGFERNADNPLRGWDRGEDYSLRLSAAWACVKLISGTISTLPINVFERMPDGTRRFAPEHPVYGLLNRAPNADMTAQTYLQSYLLALLNHGRATGEKRYIGSRLVAINYLDPRRLNNTSNPDGSFTWRYMDRDGTTRVIPENRLWSTIGLSVDGVTPMTPIRMGAGVFASGLQSDFAANSTFERGLMPTTYFKFPKVLKKDQREDARKAIRKISGALHAGEPAILEAEMDVGNIGINPKDAQLLESRAWSVEEICRWYGVPPFMVGHSAKSTSWGTGLEQQNLGFVTYCLRTWLKAIEQSANRSLFADQDRYYVEFALEGLLRADSAARAALYASAAQNGWMTRNEIRRLENLPENDVGDELTAQSNLLPLDKLGESAAATPAGAAAAVDDAVKNFLGVIGHG